MWWNEKQPSPATAKAAVVCDCGGQAAVSAAQAGTKVPCPACGKPLVVPPLSKLFPIPTEDDPPADSPPRKRFQFSLRSLMLAVAFCAIILSLAMQSWRTYKTTWPEEIDYSWMDGGVRVRAEKAGQDTLFVAEGGWTKAPANLRIRYILRKQNKGGDTRWYMSEDSVQLREFTGASTTPGPYPPRGGFPFRVIFDYEIWDGRPERGTLLVKDSAFSPWYDRVPAAGQTGPPE